MSAAGHVSAHLSQHVGFVPVYVRRGIPTSSRRTQLWRLASIPYFLSSLSCCFTVVTTCEYRLVMHSVGSVCVCLFVYPVLAPTFESLDLETSFLLCGYFLRISSSYYYIKVIGSRSNSQERKSHTSLTKCTHSQVIYLPLKSNSFISGNGPYRPITVYLLTLYR